MARKFTLIIPVFLFAALALSILSMPVSASVQPQAYYQTPTAHADGRIMYVVNANDTCISISLLNNISEDNLRKLNNLQSDCVLQVGQVLLLGTVTPGLTPTTGPTATPTPLLPTPTAFNGTGEVCIFLFEDLNGNAQPDTNEGQIPGGAVSLNDKAGKVSLTNTTTSDANPLCFTALAEGDYNISVGVPEGYNPTTSMNYPLTLKAGDKTILDFGAQLSTKARPVSPADGGRSPILGILGAICILGGIGLGIYMWKFKR
jgi:LysM repeat protein